MNSEEFNALKIGDHVMESSYSPDEKYREEQEYEVSTRYSNDMVGLIPVISQKERKAKRKKPGGKLLRNGPDLIFYRKVSATEEP